METLDEYAGLTSIDHLTVVKKEIYRTELYTVAFFTKLLIDMGIPPSTDAPEPAFTMNRTIVYPGEAVAFHDKSTGNPT